MDEQGDEGQERLEDKARKDKDEAKPLGRVLHSEPLVHRPLSEALGRLPKPDLAK